MVHLRTLIRATLMSARPPQRTDSSAAPSGAVRTPSHSGNAAFSPANARDELVSVVFCDRIVRTCVVAAVALSVGSGLDFTRGQASTYQEPPRSNPHDPYYHAFSV